MPHVDNAFLHDMAVPMNRSGMSRTVAMAIGLLVVTAAAIAQSDAEERKRIHAERSVAAARLMEAEQVCQKQFVVTSCLDEARRENRATLTRLRSQELVLDDAQRKQRAAQRLQEIETNTQREAAQQRDHAASAPGRAPRRPSEPHVVIRSSPKVGETRPSHVGAPRGGAAASSSEERRADELRKAAAFDARRQAAEARRVKVTERNAEHAESGKIAAPLPMPNAASAPRSSPPKDASAAKPHSAPR